MIRELKRFGAMGVVGLGLLWGQGAAMASEAGTSASAGGQPGQDSAAASAHYEGDRGWAHTDTRSGAFGMADGVAIGVDQNGFSVSVSDAVSLGGQAVAGGFSLSADRSGTVTTSGGVSQASGASQRTASADATTSNAAHDHAAQAVSHAAASSDPDGTAQASTQSSQASPFHGAVALGRAPARGRPLIRHWSR